MPIGHAKSITVADLTGTITFWQGTTTASIAATDDARPSDWNSAHTLAFTLTGNTTNNTTVSGTDIIFAGSGGVSVGGSNGSIIISGPSNPAISTFVPYFPMSTSSQTQGAIGVTTASAAVFPVIFEDAVVFNNVRFLLSASLATSTTACSQTITSNFAIYSNNAGTLSAISTGSFSMALSQSSVSGTLSFPTATSTSGYGYGTTSWSTTANAQSLVGTAGNRVVGLQFGGNMTLNPGIYWIGLHQRQNTANAAAGLSTALIGNAMNATSNVGPFGQSTAAFSNSSAFHLGAHGFYTSTGSAGYSGTTAPSSMILTAFNNNLNVMPMVTFMST